MGQVSDCDCVTPRSQICGAGVTQAFVRVTFAGKNNSKATDRATSAGSDSYSRSKKITFAVFVFGTNCEDVFLISKRWLISFPRRDVSEIDSCVRAKAFKAI